MSKPWREIVHKGSVSFEQQPVNVAPEPPVGMPQPAIVATRRTPRTFVMVRGRDESGVSGTGVVLEGVIFSDGRVALRWMSTNRSTVTYDSFEDFWTNHVDSHPNNETQIYFSDGAVRAQ